MRNTRNKHEKNLSNHHNPHRAERHRPWQPVRLRRDADDLDRRQRHHLRDAGLTEAQLNAESDKSPGVLLASGYIAGGAIAGIIIALVQGVLIRQNTTITQWAERANPFYAGAHSDLLALIPFALLCGLLYWVGRGGSSKAQSG